MRSEDGLRQGLARVGELREAAADVDVRPTSGGYADLAHRLELRSALLAAEATVLGAIERRETRGAHNRSDYPELNEDLRVNIVVRLGRDDRLKVTHAPVPPVPADLQAWTAKEPELQVKGRLLE